MSIDSVIYGSNKKRLKTTHKEILEYWSSKIYEGDMGIDWDDGLVRCWRCGIKQATKSLHRCHIIPQQFGGLDEPSNYVILCSSCHSDAPSFCSDVDIIWDWIKKTSYSFYGEFYTVRLIKEFESIFKRKPDMTNFDFDKFSVIIDDIGLHFNTITRSSLVYALYNSGA